VILKTATPVGGAVTRKLMEPPLLKLVSIGAPEPLAPYVGVPKSDVRAKAGPVASLTVTVHEITSEVRTYVVVSDV